MQNFRSGISNFDGDMLGFGFCDAADVDIGSIEDDFEDLMTGYPEIEQKPDVNKIAADLRRNEVKNVSFNSIV